MRKINSGSVEVTRDDQTSINNFSKLHQRRQEVDEAIVKLKEKIQLHQDTLDEIDMNDDDDPLRYRFGACFLQLPSN
jgi:prefoldin subunit 4